MAIRGQRFHLDLDSEEDESSIPPDAKTALSSLALGSVRDVCERSAVDAPKPPAPPALTSSTTGFPAHKKRVRPSTFKQQRTTAVSTDKEAGRPAVLSALEHGSPRAEPTGPGGSAARGARDDARSGDEDRKAIGEENRQKLARMSAEEIERERAELVAGMSSSLIDRLLKRANIDDGRTDTDDGFGVAADPPVASSHPRTSTSDVAKGARKVTFVTAADDHDPSHSAPKDMTSLPDSPDPQDLQSTTSSISVPDRPAPQESQAGTSFTPIPPNVHFPRPPEAPSLDPADPDFLKNMHARYFPEFPVDPNQLAWMAPIPTEGSPADQDSPYNPAQDTLTISSIRFDFRGRLIPPRLARQILVTYGLHHHGQAPEAAGYTIPELAHLSRSSVAAQRCIAYQTLGRVLYRLGRGDFGDEGEDLYLGLWKCVEEGRVVDTLAAEANKEDGKGNRSCKVTATEALWLWQKGGGKKWKAQ
ncbi:hypothetical protein MMC26_005073 [Xylographa opegraphella]|nr:hypothetical protein [Xylographa opegraphella]